MTEIEVKLYFVFTLNLLFIFFTISIVSSDMTWALYYLVKKGGGLTVTINDLVAYESTFQSRVEPHEALAGRDDGLALKHTWQHLASCIQALGKPLIYFAQWMVSPAAISQHTILTASPTRLEMQITCMPASRSHLSIVGLFFSPRMLSKLKNTIIKK